MFKKTLTALIILLGIFYLVKAVVDQDISTTETVAVGLLLSYAAYHICAFMHGLEMYAGTVPLTNSAGNKWYRLIALVIAVAAYAGTIIWVEVV